MCAWGTYATCKLAPFVVRIPLNKCLVVRHVCMFVRVLSGGSSAQYVLWNFFESDVLAIDDVYVQGTVLAPFAAVCIPLQSVMHLYGVVFVL